MKKMNELILRIEFGVKYVKARDRNLFIVSSFLGIIGLIVIVCLKECSIIVGIGQSIFAAYIFYVFLDFLPQVFLAYDESYQEKMSYDLLRIMLMRLDDLFIEPFKQIYKEKELPNLEGFFSEEFLLDFLCKFDVAHAKSNAGYPGFDGKIHHLTFIQYAQQYWNEIQGDIQDLIFFPYIRENNELFSLLQYLKHSSYLVHYFKLINMMNMVSLPNIPYVTIIGYGQDGNNHFYRQEGTVESIVRLHLIAFDIYKRLMNDQRWKEIFPPPFYEKSIG